jgi:dTDP-glucose 4,6-dehydratase
MIINAIHDRPLPVYGDGKNVRDWIHVKDHCEAIDLIIHEGKEGEIYNIGGENERSNIEVVKMILKELSKPESLIKFVKDRPGHDRRYALDITKMKEEFGWSPKISFEEGLRSTIKWYLENRNWWEEIINGEYMKYYEKMYGERLKE